MGTPIATPECWTAMGELKVGDHVFGSEGKPCVVTAAYEPRLLDCWRSPWNGSELIADGDHLWRVQDRNSGGHGAVRKWKVVDTREIARDPAWWGLPPSPVLDLPEWEPPIHLCALGAWAGDGNMADAGFTCAEPELAEHLASCGEPIRHRNSYRWTFSIGYNCGPKHKTFHARLRRLGLLGRHLPTTYLRGSYEWRLALLQRGLMDTNGSVYPNESGFARCELATTCKRLAEDALTLTRSLGIHSRLHESRATLNDRDVGPGWRLRFTTKLPVFRLKRKLDRLYGTPGPRKPRFRNGIISVKPVPSTLTRCIEVGSPDRTYLAGTGLILFADLVPTGHLHYLGGPA